MFAILAEDTLYLKADEFSARAFADEGKSPFTYRPKGRIRSPCPTGRCQSACSTIRRSWSPGQGARMPWHSLLKPSRSADPAGLFDLDALQIFDDRLDVVGAED